MKLLLRNLPIKHKLVALTVGISGVALLLACAAFAIYEQAAFRRTMARDFVILANMFDDNVAPGLAFNDSASIEQTLKTLSANPHILAACAYNKAGTVMGGYRRAGAAPEGEFQFPAARPTSQHFGPDRLDTFQDVTLAGEIIGIVYIGTDLTELSHRVWRYVILVGLLLIACSLVALLLAAPLQRIISQPILDLAQTVATVTTGKNYAVRAPKQSDDELGRLVEGFNEMLAQIQARDSALQSAHNHLEQRVEERTAKLAEASGLLDAMLENTPDLIYFKDRESRFVRFSKACLLRFGLAEPGMLYGKTDADIFTARHAQAAQADEQRIISSGEPIIGKLEQETYAGDRVTWALTTKMPWRDGTGKIIGSFGISKDVTAWKDAEAQLALTHKQLLETSRLAGMAEVATGVLHNVGNVLNSVNVSATLVADHVSHTEGVKIAKLATLFDQHKADLAGFLTKDPRGQMIPNYLTILAEGLVQEQKTITAELDHLRKNIEHIKDIVAMQQSYAKTSGVIETVSVPDMIEDALRMNSGSLARHEVGVSRDYQARGVVTTDKHKVMQILINLVRNAKYACDESGRTDKQITVRTTSDGHGVKIAVIDNGVGIPPENLTRIFNHGFTTRKNGHGFGLHSGALAAREIGGSLSVQSDGPGHGATFILELPHKPATPAHEKLAR